MSDRWQHRALCAEVDPESFFVERGVSQTAKSICQRCEVRGECLEDALERDERFGVWGGMSVGERDRLIRKAG